jgi:hypothetical protein
MTQLTQNGLIPFTLFCAVLIACDSERDCPRWTFQGDTAIDVTRSVRFTAVVCRDEQSCSVGSLAAAAGEDAPAIELDGDLTATFEVHPSPETASWQYLALVPSDNPSVSFTLVDETSETTLVSGQIHSTIESCPTLTIDLGP